MFDLFEQLTKVIKSGKVCIDNNVFALHYKLTVVILMVFSLIISSRKYFGDPIDCTSQEQTKEIVDNYCWFNVYIIVPKNPNDIYEGDYDRFQPVINQHVKSFKDLEDPNSKYTYYFLHAYQWIEFFLCIQAICFFVPRYLWRYCFEQGRVKALTENFRMVSLKQEDDHARYEDIIKYFRRNRHDHFEYAWKFIVCEILNFINVLVQFLILQRGLGLDWRTLAEDFFSSQSNIDPKHPLNRVFPNFARCEVPTPTGATHLPVPQFCVLPVNVFITKMYIFLWFYFYVLVIISGTTLIYRTLTLFFPGLRLFILNRTGKHLPEDCVKHVRNLDYGDWFLLCLVGKNMDPFSFRDLVRGYADAIMASRPSFSLIGSDKIYNPDLAAMHMKRESMKPVQVVPQ